jgi:hypothetical protein
MLDGQFNALPNAAIIEDHRWRRLSVAMKKSRVATSRSAGG